MRSACGRGADARAAWPAASRAFAVRLCSACLPGRKAAYIADERAPRRIGRIALPVRQLRRLRQLEHQRPLAVADHDGHEHAAAVGHRRLGAHPTGIDGVCVTRALRPPSRPSAPARSAGRRDRRNAASGPTRHRSPHVAAPPQSGVAMALSSRLYDRKTSGMQDRTTHAGTTAGRLYAIPAIESSSASRSPAKARNRQPARHAGEGVVPDHPARETAPPAADFTATISEVPPVRITTDTSPGCNARPLQHGQHAPAQLVEHGRQERIEPARVKRHLQVQLRDVDLRGLDLRQRCLRALDRLDAVVAVVVGDQVEQSLEFRRRGAATRQGGRPPWRACGSGSAGAWSASSATPTRTPRTGKAFRPRVRPPGDARVHPCPARETAGSRRSSGRCDRRPAPAPAVASTRNLAPCVAHHRKVERAAAEIHGERDALPPAGASATGSSRRGDGFGSNCVRARDPHGPVPRRAAGPPARCAIACTTLEVHGAPDDGSVAAAHATRPRGAPAHAAGSASAAPPGGTAARIPAGGLCPDHPAAA